MEYLDSSGPGPEVLSGMDVKQKSASEMRDYQAFVVDLATKKNIIACLPTGSGKTLIAVELTKFYLNKAIENGQKIIFLTSTVPLAKQQADYFRAQLCNDAIDNLDSHHVDCLTGERNVQVWKGDTWDKVLSNCQVLVMTAQIFLDAVNHAYIGFEKVILLVIDECHHASKDDPMNKIMERYREYRERRLHQGSSGDGIGITRILGLTASIINGKNKLGSVGTEVRAAEDRLCCKAVTYHKYEEVLKYSTNAKIEYITYHEKVDGCGYLSTEVGQCLRQHIGVISSTQKSLKLFDNKHSEGIGHHSLLNDHQLYLNRFSELKDLVSSINDVLDVYEDLGPYCARLAAIHKQAILGTLTISDFKNISAQMMYYAAGPQLLTFISELDRLMSAYSQADQIEIFISEKLKKLLTVLDSYAKLDLGVYESGSCDNKELCGIIFVQKRLTAQILKSYLQDLRKVGSYGFVRACSVVGMSNFDPVEARITAKIQASILQGFRAKEYNLMVATNVVEEGLDVPACNLVVRFDKIQSYPSYIQSMGRARSKNSKFYAMVKASEETKQVADYDKFRKFSVELSEHLKLNAIHADDDSMEMDVDGDEGEDARIIPDFIPIAGGARITANDAISIAYRYCQTLPCDRLVTLTPVSWWKPVINQGYNCYQAFVQFPSNAVIRDVIEGGLFKSKKLAKRSAFLEACKRLYEKDVLDDKLFPLTMTAKVCFDFFQKFIPAEKDSQGRKVGSNKRTQKYKKRLPLDSGVTILPGAILNVYELVIELLEPPTSEIPVSLYQFRKRQYSYCLITPLDLSMIPQFILNVSTSIGLLTVGLEAINDSFILYETEIVKLQEFQRYLFGDLLKLESESMSPAQSSSFLVAPLIKRTHNNNTQQRWSLSVHWELVDQLCNITNEFFKPPPDEIRRTFRFDAELYDDALLVPWYREDEKHYFTVMSVMTGTTPFTKFPTEKKYKSYLTYFMLKYPTHINFIADLNQPLLKAKAIANNLNFFSLRATFKKNKTERSDDKGNTIELIPELNNLHPMPASLYIQSKFLPSIIQRINRFLSAWEIQKFVASGTRWEFKTARMDFDEELSSLGIRAEVEAENEVTDGAEPPRKKSFRNDSVKAEQCVNERANVACSSDDDEETEVTETYPSQRQGEQREKNANNTWKIGNGDKNSRVLLETVHPNEMTNSHIQDVKGYEMKRRQKKAEIRRSSYSRNESASNYSEFVEWDYAKESKIELPDFALIDELLKHSEKFDRSHMSLDDEEQPSLYTIMQAITTEGSEDNVSLERMETMGDSFLKYCVSRHVYTFFPDYNEGHMSRFRAIFVSNAYLFSNAKNLPIGEYLAAGIWKPHAAWLPPAYEISEVLAEAPSDEVNDDSYNGDSSSHKNELSADDLESIVSEKSNAGREPPLSNVSYTHGIVSDKSVADSVEALIGAYFVAAGPRGALHFMGKLGLRGPCLKESGSVEFSSVAFGNWLNFPPTYNPGDDCVKNHLPFYEELEQLIGYKFKDPWLLVEAFSHASYRRNRVTCCYERLEFLGDSVLDFLVTSHIFRASKKLKPGDLTDLRSALVNNVTFGSLAVRYGMHKYLRHDSEKTLQDRIDDFVTRQREVQHKVYGHFKLLSDFDCPLVEDIEVPKVLGDIFESLTGAVFVDSGMSLDIVWRIVYRLMKNEIDEFSQNVPKSPVRILHEKFPGRSLFKEWTEEQLNVMIPNRKPGITYVTLIIPVDSGQKVQIINGTGKSKQSAKIGLAKYYNYLEAKRQNITYR